MFETPVVHVLPHYMSDMTAANERKRSIKYNGANDDGCIYLENYIKINKLANRTRAIRALNTPKLRLVEIQSQFGQS